jgi:hypothetical protein
MGLANPLTALDTFAAAGFALTVPGAGPMFTLEIPYRGSYGH